MEKRSRLGATLLSALLNAGFVGGGKEMLPKNAKITSKTNHDKLWLKATIDKNNWFRIGVTRSGWRVSGKGNMRLNALMAKKKFEELLDANFSYGDAIEYLRLELVA